MKMLTDAVKDDFNYLLIFASALVIIAMLLVYGSIELTLVSFIPIAISWIWILGIAALLDFKFNFVNIIIVTFIFGLGDDFAIFITDGLQTKFKYGRKVLGHYKTGIVLSSASTVIGTGVLFFAKHPAIKSIAAISVTGILTIVFVSFFVQPIIFNFFTSRRTKVGKPPVTLIQVLISIIGYTIFIVGSLIGVFMGFMIRLTPFKSTEWKKAMLHKMLKVLTGLMLDILVFAKKRYYHLERLDFTKPSVIIANHASFFDILAIARLNPNIVMLVNKWVYDSFLFGNAIRYADYLPTFESLDENLDKAEKLVKKGYSIMVFPEGKRSIDGKVGRFHKGAFFLAEKLKLDITPIILHGYAYVMPKYDYNFKHNFLSTWVLPRIKHEDHSFGSGYKARTKLIGAYFKAEYDAVVDSCGAKDYQYFPLLQSYRYKGPILEWYFRIKWKFEKNHYENYYQMIGRGHKRVYDLGCGYGYLSYFLKLRNENLEVFGFDYDEDKVAVAQNSYLKSEGIEFQSADISTIKPTNADAIIIADTLHYLSEELQLKVLSQCNEGMNPGGILLVRDGLSDVGNTHEWTENSEKWSTKIVKFNKVKGELHFFSKSFIENWAQQNNYQIEFDLQSKNSSNTLMILKKW
jgi:1-acyl-sn-glycerol-3-phosphate acyltransferase